MQRINGRLLFSPSDLIVFMECDFVSWMDRFHLEHPEQAIPDPQPEILTTIFAAGEEHENEYLEKLAADGTPVTDLSQYMEEPAPTIEAMRRGDPILYQAYLRDGDFAGYADFLVRVEGESQFGDWHYEVQDTKLAREPRPYFLVQLCCYAELLRNVQGIRPAYVAVVLGTNDKEIGRFRTDDFFFFYTELKEAFLAQQAKFPDGQPPIRGKEDFGRWETYAEALLEQQDHLCRVANISRLQIARLQKAEIDTMNGLATSALNRVERMLPATFQKLQKQARLQIASVGKEQPDYELLPVDLDDQRRGLALLPPVNDGDIFFDLEGYPLIEGGLEYLFGACFWDSGTLRYREWWAHDREAEKAAFAEFVKWAHARWRSCPGMHIYHYAAYEEAAIRRLLLRYPGICENEVDDLLRNEVFVDLYTVVRQSLIVGEPRYSLKNIERLYRKGERSGAVATADDSIVAYDKWLREKDGQDVSNSEKLLTIRDYNRDDCTSTVELADWLRKLQAQHNRAYIAPSTGPEPKTRPLTDAEILAQELASEIPPQSQQKSEEAEKWRIQELLANLLMFHRREDKPMWWAMFARHEMTEEQLAEDLDCLSGLERTATPPERLKRSLAFEYRFDPDQDTKLDVGSECILAHDIEYHAEIVRFDHDAGTLAIKVGPSKPTPPQKISLIPYEYVDAQVITESILKTVRQWRTSGTLPSNLSDFLHRSPPRITGHAGGSIISGESDLVEATVGASSSLDNSTLVVQGPPGTGKTYTAARAILALIRVGRRVGISGNSHKSINLLLNEVAKIAAEAHIAIRGVHVWRNPGDDDVLASGFDYVSSPKELPPLQQLNIIGGTAWAFSAPELEGAFSHLFIDEAGQVSIANLVGMARSAGNLVLLGDPMQLNQPIKGCHPGECGQSCLKYFLQDHDTIPDELGIFLAVSRRLHPAVCSFVSGICYEDRLSPLPGTENRVLHLDQNAGSIPPSGLLFVPVEHEGNSQGSDEEVEEVARLTDTLLKHAQFRDGQTTRKLTPDDLLIIAPYNMQVRALRRRLPGFRVGTVDKFQGQEAPVVIYSMSASSSEECPRGMDFLFSRNRTNVAVSRAQCLAIVVASPSLIHARCTSIERMRLANIFCRIVIQGSTQISVAARPAYAKAAAACPIHGPSAQVMSIVQGGETVHVCKQCLAERNLSQ